MESINLGGTTYNAADLIQAIQESNDAEHQQALENLNTQVNSLQVALSERVEAITTLTTRVNERDVSIATLTAKVAELEATSGMTTENGNLLQAVLIRLNAIEAQLPIPRTGYSVTTIPGDTATTHIVRTIDELGRQIKTTYEVPTT